MPRHKGNNVTYILPLDVSLNLIFCTATVVILLMKGPSLHCVRIVKCSVFKEAVTVRLSYCDIFFRKEDGRVSLFECLGTASFNTLHVLFASISNIRFLICESRLSIS